MRVEVRVPRMGQSMDEGKVLRWLLPAGAAVKRGDALAELETDKAAVEIEAPVAGTLLEAVVPEGASAAVGALLAVIDDGRPAGIPARPVAAPAVAAPVAAPQAVAEPPAEAPAPHPVRPNASPLARRLAAELGVDLAQVTGSGPEGRIGKEDVERQARAKRPAAASPVARRIAAEQGVDLAQVTGTGPDGRIGKEDVERWLAARSQTVPAAPEPAPAVARRRVPLSKMRQAIARRMAASKAAAPHFYVSIEVEMDRALALRASLKKRGLEVTVNDLLLKAAALSLADFPALNAAYADEAIEIHPQIDLAVAVALDEGLITPVLHGCESLSLTALAEAARALFERARAGRLRPEDLQGGTFTVSNLGMFGVSQFQAILNPPQAAILAAGALRRVPVFDAADRVVPVQLLTVTLSADHRATDGAEAARFLRRFKEVLEDAFILGG